jgi:hypothetical protein
MAITYNGNTMGVITIDQNGNEFELQIRQGNCLAVIICVGKNEGGETIHTLMQFFADAEHLKNVCKAVDKGEYKGYDAPIFYDVKSIRLNMRYKECATLLKHLVRYYKVTCYYK